MYGEHVTVHNVRQARYRSVTDYDVEYSNWTFKLSDIEKAWVLIEPFGNFSFFGLNPAHILISFQLKNKMYLSVSPEIRKKKDEKFSPFKGFFRSYEIMYVMADETDVVQLRTNYRKDTVRLYPLALKDTRVQKLFSDMAKKVNRIHEKAVFFNTAIHSCTTSISQHLRHIGVHLPKHHILYLLPGTIDSIFHTQGLLDTKLPLEEARVHFNVTHKGQKCKPTEDFSQCIRTT